MMLSSSDQRSCEGLTARQEPDSLSGIVFALEGVEGALYLVESVLNGLLF